MGGCAVPSTTPFILLHPHVRCDETFVRGMFDDAQMARQLPSTANNIRSACVVSVVILGSWRVGAALPATQASLFCIIVG